MSHNPLILIAASLTCSLPFPSPMHVFSRHLESFVSDDVHMDSRLVDNLFDMPKRK